MANKKKTSSSHPYGSPKKSKKKFPVWLLIVLILIILICLGLAYYFLIYKKTPEPGERSEEETSLHSEASEEPYVGDQDEISFHFLQSGNANSGDCIFVKAGDTDILIDGGSNTTSLSTIEAGINEFCTDKKLEYVVVTHAHKDHIACFGIANKGLFRDYSIGTIIDFPKTDSTTQIYSRYLTNRDYAVSQGATHYTALECWNANDAGTYEDGKPHREWNLGKALTMDVLYQDYYEKSSSNNENLYSVCVQFSQGNNKFLFTGDLEEEGHASLIEKNNLSHVKLFKAGHHGSGNANSAELYKAITPETVVICAVAGNQEYASKPDNSFPYQSTIDVIAPYTTNVFCTMQGSWSDKTYKAPLNGQVDLYYRGNQTKLHCSHNTTVLKDSEWFNKINDCHEGAANRTWPSVSSQYTAPLATEWSKEESAESSFESVLSESLLPESESLKSEESSQSE